MKPFVVNRHGRLVFPSNFFPELDFSVFETLEQLDAVITRDFEAKAPTGTDILARVEAGGYRDAVRAAARPRAQPVLGQPLRDDDVREAPDAVARRAAPARRRLPAGPQAVGGRRAQDRRGRRACYARSSRPGTRAPRTRIFRILFDVFRHKQAPRHRAARRSSRPWPRCSPSPANLTFCLAAHDPDYPGYGHDDILDCSEEVPELEALIARRWSCTTSTRGTARRRGCSEVGDARRRRLRGACSTRATARSRAVHPARQGGPRRAPRPARRPPSRAQRRSAVPAGGRARALRGAAAPRGAGGRTRASTSARTRT